MRIFLFVVLLCGPVSAYLEDLYLEDPYFYSSFEYGADYTYDEDTTAKPGNVTTPAQTIPKPVVDVAEVEDIEIYMLKPKECQPDEQAKQLQLQITSMKDDISKKMSNLEADVRHNTASVTNVLDSMDVLAGVMNELKELVQSGQFQEHTTPFPSTTPMADPECRSPFRWEGGGCFYLEEYQKKTWSEAVDFCRQKGASLAEPDDLPRLSRHLHNSIGELGTRVRWPLWLGGQRLLSSGTDSWFWLKKETKIPSDVWNGGILRDNWNCMALDGYNMYKPISLECHVKRRFLCEKKSSW